MTVDKKITVPDAYSDTVISSLAPHIPTGLEPAMPYGLRSFTIKLRNISNLVGRRLRRNVSACTRPIIWLKGY